MKRTAKPVVVVGMLLLLLSAALMAFLVRSPYEITRLRNSLIADVGASKDFAWSPESPPHDYSIERLEPPTYFLEIVRSESLIAPDLALGRALKIASHLTGGDVTRGDPVQSSTQEAYDAITQHNLGYCSDYTQVFNALSIAADVPVREWGMSFDGFSGDGHAFNEIYDDGLGKWVFIDSFYSFYVVDPATGIPLSVLELRAHLLDGGRSLSAGVTRIDPSAFTFKSNERALEYYREGANQFYLWFANDAFSYDANWFVRAAAPLGRPVEQAVAILAGAHPKIRIVPESGTAPSEEVRALAVTRLLFFGTLGLGTLGCLFWLYALLFQGAGRLIKKNCA